MLSIWWLPQRARFQRAWLWFTTLRVNNRLFRDQTLQQLTATLFEDYGALPRWEWRVQGQDSPFTMAVQGAGWGKSDHTRLESAGVPALFTPTGAHQRTHI